MEGFSEPRIQDGWEEVVVVWKNSQQMVIIRISSGFRSSSRHDYSHRRRYVQPHLCIVHVNGQIMRE